MHLTPASAIKGALLGGAVAAAINVVIYFLGGLAGAVYVTNTPEGGVPGEAIPFYHMLISTMVPAVVGGLLLAGLVKLTAKRAWPIFLGLSAIIYVLMVPGPFMQLASKPAAIAFEFMHVVAVAGILLGIRRASRA